MRQYHWSEIRLFNITPTLAMMSPSGEIRQMSCILKSESPRTTNSQVRQVIFDKSYIVYRLQKLLEPLQNSCEINSLLELAKSAIEG